MVKALVTLLFLGGICGALLSGTAYITEAPIAANRLAAEQALLRDMLGEQDKAWLATAEWQNDQLGTCQQGRFIRHSVDGYGGPIRLLSLYQPQQGWVVRTISHSETPGIGDFIDHRRDSWLPERDGTTRSQWQQLDNVSGATITTQAVQRAVIAVMTDASGACDD